MSRSRPSPTTSPHVSAAKARRSPRRTWRSCASRPRSNRRHRRRHDRCEASLFAKAKFEVSERQWRPGLERLDRDVAAYFAHDWQIEKFADQKALVVTEIRYDDFEEIVRFAGDEVARDDLRHLDDGLLERRRALVGVPVDLDADEDREPKADAVAPQRRPITFDVAIPLQALDAAQARRWRQADLVGQFDIAQASIGLQLGDDAAVDGIQIMFWHTDASLELKRADCRSFLTKNSAVCKDVPAGRLSRLPVSATPKSGIQQCPIVRPPIP